MFQLITIDTEEDTWGKFDSSHHSLENLRKIPEIQDLFDKFGVRPTYLITYQVATDQWAIDLFSNYLAQGKCEIGMHCHPWNTPPFEEVTSAYNSMLCNLPEDLQYRKLELLKKTICKNFGITPVSFRAGRWAFGSGTARAIHKLGFKIDTSVTAYTNWSDWHGADYRDIGPGSYRFSHANIAQEIEKGELFQVPATVGYLQRNFEVCNTISKMLDGPFLHRCHIKGILRRLGLLSKVDLSPETSTSQNMIALAERMQELGFEFINLFFHSTSLMHGLSPFVKSREDEIDFLRSLENFLSFSSIAGMVPLTLSQLEEKELLLKK